MWRAPCKFSFSRPYLAFRRHLPQTVHSTHNDKSSDYRPNCLIPSFALAHLAREEILKPSEAPTFTPFGEFG